MPDFIGMNYEEIINDMSYSFSYKIVYEFNNDYGKDCVIDQRPVSGKEVYSNVLVTLTVSNGSERLIVPTIDGMNYDEYSAVCLNLGLSTKKYLVYDATIEAGNIINTNPLPRADVNEGDNIEVFVSLGPKPEELLMPNFQNMLLDDANMRLSAMGIGAATTEMVDSDKPAGTIISQKPNYGTKIIPGTTVVEFIISNGTAPTGTIDFNVDLPVEFEGQSVRVEVKIGDEIVFSQNFSAVDSLSVPISITAAGTSKTAQVCLNGYIYKTMKMNFETQEILSQEMNPDYKPPTPTTTTEADQTGESTEETTTVITLIPA